MSTVEPEEVVHGCGEGVYDNIGRMAVGHQVMRLYCLCDDYHPELCDAWEEAGMLLDQHLAQVRGERDGESDG